MQGAKGLAGRVLQRDRHVTLTEPSGLRLGHVRVTRRVMQGGFWLDAEVVAGLGGC